MAAAAREHLCFSPLRFNMETTRTTDKNNFSFAAKLRGVHKMAGGCPP
jgi:hypothetical protein